MEHDTHSSHSESDPTQDVPVLPSEETALDVEAGTLEAADLLLSAPLNPPAPSQRVDRPPVVPTSSR